MRIPVSVPTEGAAIAAPAPAAEGAARAGAGRFGALASPAYRQLWIATLANNTGTWMQITATGWLVLQLSNSASDLGITVALQGLPVLIFSLLGGVVADRIDRYRLVIAAQAAIIIPDVLLTLLVVTNQVTVEHVYIYSLVTGFLSSVSNPSRRSLIPHYVRRDQLLSAMALDGTLWNGAAIIGPALAGLLIAQFGLQMPFYINVVSDFVGLACLLLIRKGGPKIVQATSAWKNVGEGLRYGWETPSVRWLLLVTLAVAFLGRSYFPLAPVFASDVFHTGPEGLGLISSVPAVGTVVGSIALAFASSVSRRLLLFAAVATAFGLAGYAVSPSIQVALPFLFVVGASGFGAQTMASTLLQQTVDEHMRGRVMSLFAACTLAAWRLAGLPFGFAAQHWSAPVATIGGAILLFLVLLPSLRTMVLRSRQVLSIP